MLSIAPTLFKHFLDTVVIGAAFSDAERAHRRAVCKSRAM